MILKRDLELHIKIFESRVMIHPGLFTKLGNEMGIPFEVSVDPFYSAENQKVLARSNRQLEAGHGTEHELVQTDE